MVIVSSLLLQGTRPFITKILSPTTINLPSCVLKSQAQRAEKLQNG